MQKERFHIFSDAQIIPECDRSLNPMFLRVPWKEKNKCAIRHVTNDFMNEPILEHHYMPYQKLNITLVNETKKGKETM